MWGEILLEFAADLLSGLADLAVEASFKRRRGRL